MEFLLPLVTVFVFLFVTILFYHTQSDLLKCCIAIYIILNRGMISSPNSDIWAMILVLYINVKWAEYHEKKVVSAAPWAHLCILSVYALTIKLSAAACVILVIYPAYLLIKRKQWLSIIFNLFAGLIVLLPFLIRNVIISGYLIYPYPQINLFDVDWKMPESVLTYDSREIMVWGRGVNDVAKYKMSFSEWFPSWYRMQEVGYQILIIIGLLSTFCILLYLGYCIYKKKEFNMCVLILTGICGLAVWLFTAPLMRYGLVFLIIPVCLTINIAQNFKSFNIKIVTLIVMFLFAVIYMQKLFKLKEIPIIYQDDYEN